MSWCNNNLCILNWSNVYYRLVGDSSSLWSLPWNMDCQLQKFHRNNVTVTVSQWQKHTYCCLYTALSLQYNSHGRGLWATVRAVPQFAQQISFTLQLGLISTFKDLNSSRLSYCRPVNSRSTCYTTLQQSELYSNINPSLQLSTIY